MENDAEPSMKGKGHHEPKRKNLDGCKCECKRLRATQGTARAVSTKRKRRGAKISGTASAGLNRIANRSTCRQGGGREGEGGRSERGRGKGFVDKDIADPKRWPMWHEGSKSKKSKP